MAGEIEERVVERLRDIAETAGICSEGGTLRAPHIDGKLHEYFGKCRRRKAPMISD